MSKHSPISGVIREACLKSDMSLYRIALKAGIDHGVLRRFVNEGANAKAETLDAIAMVLDLEVTQKKKSKT